MPIYEDETRTRDELFELRKWNRCQVCRGPLGVFLDPENHRAFLACWDWPRTHHKGIEREAEPRGLETLNIPTRREIMVEELGEKKTNALEKYVGVVSLTKVQAMDIMRTIWPEAPDLEVLKAAMLCAQYGLNPLMKHVALIKFKRRNRKREVIGEDWVTVMEISSNRLIARRRHNYSYLDLSPRRMTEKEQTKINGEVDNTKVWALTHLRDVDTAAEVFGAGFWPLDEEVHGAEKGNTKLNMAKIRSERQALNRLYPAEMPQGVEVMEGKYIEGEFTQVTEAPPSKTGSEEKPDVLGKIETRGEEEIGGRTEDGGGAGGKPAATNSSEQKGDKPPKSGGGPPAAERAAADQIEGAGFSIDPEWLDEALRLIKWPEDTTKSWLGTKFKVDTKGDLKREVLPRCTKEQAEAFVAEVQTRLSKIQMKLGE